MTPATHFNCNCSHSWGQAEYAALRAKFSEDLESQATTAVEDSIAMILDSVCMLPSVKDILAEIASPRLHTGRPGYSVVSMLRAFLTKFLLGHESTQAFIRDLHRSDGLRVVCGLVSAVPHKSTFSRFFTKLSAHPAALEQAHAELVGAIRKYLPALGLKLAIDGTDIPAYANRFKAVLSDPDATYGYRSVKSKHGGGKAKGNKDDAGHDDIYLGYKLHLICDTVTGLPMGYTLHQAHVSESKELPNVLDRTLDLHSDWLRPHYLTGDKGFDSESNHDACMKRGIVPIIDIRKPASRGSSKHPNTHKGGLYDPIGNPTCADAGHTPMTYLGTERADDGNIYHLYGCNPEGCELKKRSSGAMLYCDRREVHRERVEEGNYRMQGPVARANPRWKELYDERSEVERLFSQLKRTRSLDKLTYRTMPKVQAHVGLSVLGYLATALGRVKAGQPDKIRSMVLEDGL